MTKLTDLPILTDLADDETKKVVGGNYDKRAIRSEPFSTTAAS